MTLLLLLGNVDQQTHQPIEVQAELNGLGQGWQNIAADVQRTPSIAFDYGITGAGPTDLVATTGRLTFALNNGQGNSANLLGYYSPDNANCRSGFAIGIGIRLVYRVNGTGTARYKFSGTLNSIEPVSGKYGERKTLCTVVDWLDEAARFRPNVSTQTSKRADEILTALVAAVPRQPRATSFSTGVATFAYALDSDENENDAVLTVLQRLAQSEFSHIYIKGDTSTGGVLTMESRTSRLTPMPSITYTDDTLAELSAGRDQSLVANVVKVTVHPRTVDAAATTVLFTLSQSPSNHTVDAGITSVIEGDYTDPTLRASRVGGINMVTPVATTDYTMNAAADGTGTDLTASFTVTATYGANRVSYSITNNSATQGYITKLQARGRGLYDYSAVDATSTDTASINTYGETQLAVDMPYEGTIASAKAVADYLLSVRANPNAAEATLDVLPANDSALDTAMSIEPGTALAVAETVTGTNAVYFVNHVSARFEMYNAVAFEFILQQAPVVNYLVLDNATLGQLDANVLAPL